MASELEVGKVKASDSIGIGVSGNPTEPLHIDGDGTADIMLSRTTGATSGNLGRIFFGALNGDAHLASVEGYQDGAVDAGGLKFSTEATGGNRITRLTIASDGTISFSGGGVQTYTDSTLNWGNTSAHGRVTWTNSVPATGDGAAIVRGLSNKELHLGANNDTSVKIATSGLVTFEDGITVSGGITTLGGFTELTVASGGITVTSSIHSVDTEGDAASDNLNTINGGSTGSILILSSADSSRDVTLKDDSDNLKLNGDCVLGSWTSTITLVKNGSVWRELSRSSN